MKTWKNLSASERTRIQILIVFMIIGMYGLVFYPISNKRFNESKKMLNRRKDRIEKRTSMNDFGGNGLNPKTISKKIEKVDRQLQELANSFDELDTGFAAVDSSDMRQQLMLEISTLAQRIGVELLSVARKGSSPKEEMTRASVDPVLGRPLLVIRANAFFWQLIDFMHGLKDLSFYVSVMNLKLYSNPPETAGRNESLIPAGTLYVSLEVSM